MLCEENFQHHEHEESKLISIEKLEAYRNQVHIHFMKAVGGLPIERTSLKPRCTRKLNAAHLIHDFPDSEKMEGNGKLDSSTYQ